MIRARIDLILQKNKRKNKDIEEEKRRNFYFSPSISILCVLS